MKKIYEKAVVIAFCLAIFFIPLVSFGPIMHQHLEADSYSFFENRNLTKRPVFTVESLFDGSYFSQWGKCYSDQIWNRDYFIESYTKFNVNILERPVVNNVVIENEVLLPFNDYNNGEFGIEEKSEKMTEKLDFLNKEIESYGGKFIYVGIPEQSSAFRNKYNERLENNNAKLLETNEIFFGDLQKKNIDYLDMSNEFTAENIDEYYFKTDHHYNLKGAFFTYQKMVEKINSEYGQSLPIIQNEEVEFVNFENPFYGSRSKKIYNVVNSDEKLINYTQKNGVPFTRVDNGIEMPSKMMYMPSNKDYPITYTVYMGGDVAETVIRTNREELPNVLIFGDSFTNPIEQFLYQSFNEMRSIDLRHYNDMAISEYIKKYKPDYVFIVRDDLSYFIETGNGDIR